MAKEITVGTMVKRNDDIVEANIDGETVMMSIDSGEYFGLDPIATKIWNDIESRQKVTAICERLQNDFDVSPEQCQTDVLNFLNALSEKSIIEISV